MERSFSGAGRFFVFMGIILSLLINQPNSQASSSSQADDMVKFYIALLDFFPATLLMK
jgi:hypothetical protein